MTDQRFEAVCERVLRSIEARLDACDIDIDSSRHGQVLTLEFDDSTRIIINGNAPVREIWVAAPSGAFHFGQQGTQWIDTRSGAELFHCLSGLVSRQAGALVSFQQD